MLKAFHTKGLIEVGCDEAGRGCLAGPVVAAAVVLPQDFSNDMLNDSKQLKKKHRDELRVIIEKEALDYAVAFINNEKIDEINILKASIIAMHQAIDQLKITPELILVDGNKFTPYQSIPYKTIVKGDGIFASIAAASILAKTYRDEYMEKMHLVYPQYQWNKNMAYATKAHRQAILKHGRCPLHRQSFRLKEENDQLNLF